MASTAMNRFTRRFPTPPWICFFCKELITFRGNNGLGLVIHHIDENHDNHSWDNITSSHASCHLSHHHKGKKLGPNPKSSITAKEVNSRKIDCPNGCGMKSNPGAIAQHSRTWNCPEFNG